MTSAGMQMYMYQQPQRKERIVIVQSILLHVINLKMKKTLSSCLLIPLLSNVSFADYYYYAKDLTSWQYIDNHTIIFSQYNQPKILVKFPFCFIYQSSNIQILTDTLGNYDGKVLIDNEVCEPTEVKTI